MSPTRTPGRHRRSSPPAVIALVLLAVALAPAGARAAAPAATGDLRGLLLRLPGDRPLRVTLDTGAQLTGHLRSVGVDSLRLTGADSQGPGTAIALAEILTLETPRSGWTTGAGIGAATGAMVGGGFGLLMGTYLSSINDSEDSDWGVVLGFTGICLLGGGLGGGLLGAGVGGLVTDWETVYPDEQDPRPTDRRHRTPPGETRLEVTAGLAAAQDGPYSPRAWGGRASLLRRIGRGLEMGPELGFFDLGETVRVTENGATSSLKLFPATQLGLGASWRPEGAGWQPYLAGGTALYLRHGAYLGASVGAGLAWQRASGSALLVDLRHHFCLPEHQDPYSRNFTTFQAGLRLAF